MAFTAKQFGRKLATIRAAFGQDREALALSSGIQAERLALLEDGATEPTGDEVLILADRFKKNFRYFLADEAIDPDADIEFLFRIRGDELPPADRIAISEFVYLCRCQAILERDLGRRPSHPGFHFKPSGTYFIGHGRRCAAELRRHLGLNDNEVIRDVFGSMRSMGFKVFRRRLENSNISGLFMRHPEAGPCVLVNLAEGMARQRFSAAHEWGHGLMDDKPIVLSTMGEWNSDALVELRANTFASDFLMPPARLSSVGSQWNDPRVVSDWAEWFRVSVPALLTALVAAKLIDKEKREEIRATMPRPPEPVDPELEGVTNPTQISRRRLLLERGISNDYVDLCFEAFSQDVISFGLLCEMLLSSASGVYEIAQLFGRSIYREG
jgi:Zn-dependent peptidase ImmA (M78 family)/transcriptional regulator with XRE-family HTH domain